MEQINKPKIAVVIQRYGENVLGGESLCRNVMKHLQYSMNITVLTTCATDYRTWSNDYPPGWQREENITILRFPVRRQRKMGHFKWRSRLVFLFQWLVNRGLRLGSVEKSQKQWLELQGPYCPDLIEFLKQNKERYDSFIFFTYLYYPTALGISHVADKAILVPCAHDERPIYLHFFRKVFTLPAAYIFLTTEERQFVNKLFKIKHKPQRVAAMQIPRLTDLASEKEISAWVDHFMQKYEIKTPYILYSGRIEAAKGAKWMFQHYLRFIRETKHPVQLILIGKNYIDLPNHPQIRYLGFLSEQEKFSAILGCQFFLMPSFYESFSISLLEALGLGKPALVNGQCTVLQGHIARSQAGFAVQDYAEFKKACQTLLDDESGEFGNRGLQYILDNYSWDKISQTYHELVDYIIEGKHQSLPSQKNQKHDHHKKSSEAVNDSDPIFISTDNFEKSFFQ